MPHDEQSFSLKQYFVPLTTGKIMHFLIIIALLLFCNGLFNNFVGDDNTQIVDSTSIHALRNIPAFFLENRLHAGRQTALGGSYYKPLLDTSFALTYSLFGPNPFGFHLFQILLFGTDACLLFLVLQRFFKKHLAFFLSLLFLVHPINSEVALYIADTQDVLFFFFGMLAVWLLIRYQSQKTLALASLLLFFSILSKETGILFFFVSLVYLFLFKRKYCFTMLGYASLFLGLYCLLRIHAMGILTPGILSAPIEKLSLASRLINAPAIFLFYLQTFLFPLHLASSYQWTHTTIDFSHFFIPLFLDLVCLATISGCAFLVYRKFPHKQFALYCFFVLWFLSGIVFHLQILPLDQTVAERWFYFPMVGLLGMIGVLWEAFNVDGRKKWVLAGVLIIIALLAFQTFVRTFDYRDDLTLALHDSKVSPEAYNLEHIISHVYYEQGKLEAAKIHAQRSIHLFPYIANYTNLGAIDSRMGDYKSAKEAYTHALRYGDDSLPYENLATLALAYGDPKENINFIKQTALKKYPQDPILWIDLAVLEYTHGNKEDALLAITQARAYTTEPTVNFLSEVMINNKPLTLQIKQGQIIYLTP